VPLDQLLVDHDGDGTVDAVGWDTTGDGLVDTHVSIGHEDHAELTRDQVRLLYLIRCAGSLPSRPLRTSDIATITAAATTRPVCTLQHVAMS